MHKEIRELIQAYKNILSKYNATLDEWEHFDLLKNDIKNIQIVKCFFCNGNHETISCPVRPALDNRRPE